ncbi:hypothetical protein AHMF7605_10290 [Adhaeribacter arboris]|uniref:Uncharacterized protein n=1 Tax=Adhaeribacter arboris TaxID=2072846 RepID=A0A2T2YED6_9BACT|nr:hypothetical protein [Adhaeribacter arboris]PSR53877.1 hypothetical protein AHMF7605_10290 [Adhaeribacter arboris]
METPVYKCDLIQPVQDIFPAFPSFQSWLVYTIKEGFSEINMQINEAEIERFVDENSYIRFTFQGIPFTIKVV